MANTVIQIKKSGTSSAVPASLNVGELAINYADGKLFYRNGSGVVTPLGTSFGTINANSSLVLASGPTDILTLLPANGITISTNTSTKTITLGLGNSSPVTETINNTALISAGSFVTSNTNQVTIDTFAVASYRSAKYHLQVTSGTSYHVLEIRILHDGTTVYIGKYGEIYTISSLGEFDAVISGGVMALLFSPVNAVSTVRFDRVALTV
jgi:hypothetical protein